jgi:hypothetical protein
MSTLQKKMHQNQIKNKNFQILEICISWPHSVKFFSETVKERGNPLTYDQKLSTQFIQRQKAHQNWKKNKYSIHLLNMPKF